MVGKRRAPAATGSYLASPGHGSGGRSERGGRDNHRPFVAEYKLPAFVATLEMFYMARGISAWIVAGRQQGILTEWAKRLRPGRQQEVSDD
ncbi:MAG: hypothetical protein Q8L54_00040 [Devosia sp.]|nr:hypothetical protein [Devosia sp.]